MKSLVEQLQYWKDRIEIIFSFLMVPLLLSISFFAIIFTLLIPNQRLIPSSDDVVLGDVDTRVSVSSPIDCGDGVIDVGEDCDSSNLGGATCLSEGYDGGTLACHSNCTFDTSACTTYTPSCGNEILDTNEQCDGVELAGNTCLTRGYDGGSLSCHSNCTFNYSQCYNYSPPEDPDYTPPDPDEVDPDDSHLLDTDGDGVPDYYEDQCPCMNKLVYDSDKDFDNDGLINIDEYKMQIDPCNEDSDNDGMPDGWEVEYGLDPLSDDSLLDPDGDGYNNITEFENQTNPNISNKKIEKLPDTGDVNTIDWTLFIIPAIVLLFLIALFLLVRSTRKNNDFDID
jgi:LPXTG-motif cell wall-anchored protein